MNHSAYQVELDSRSIESAGDLDSLVLKLDTKSEIVGHLDKFSSLLFKNGIAADVKEQLIKDSHSLLQQLTSLPLKSIEDESVQSSKTATGSKEPKEVLVLDLDRGLRLRMISKLLDVHDQARRGVHMIEEKEKLNLVKEIFAINQELSKLPFRAVRIEEHVNPASGMSFKSDNEHGWALN